MSSTSGAIRLAASVAVAVTILGALAACTGSPTVATAPASRPTAAKPSAKAASIPALRVVAIPDSATADSGSKLKPGFKTLLTGASIVSVEETATDAKRPQDISFVLTLDSAGAAKFAQITRDRLGHRIALVIGGTVLVAPSIQDPIPNGVIFFDLDNPALTRLLEGSVRPR